MTREGWMPMPDGGSVFFAEGDFGDLGFMETVLYEKDGEQRVLGMSLVRAYTPREQWPEIAARYLTKKKAT